MSLLKETLENNDKLDIPVGINVVDVLQYESAMNDFQNCYKEFLSVNEDCKNVLEKHDIINSNLKNESALKVILVGLELYTTESSLPPKELAAKALREIKIMLKNILAKFIDLFTRLKKYIIDFFKKNEDLAKTLEKQINKLGEEKKVYSLDHEEFNKHLPLITDFGNNTQISKMFHDLLESGTKLKNNDVVMLTLKNNTGLSSNQSNLIECSKDKISYLTSNDNGKLKIEVENTNFKQKDLKSRLLNKNNLSDLLNKNISFNKIADKYISDFEDHSKRLLEKINGIKDSDTEANPNLVHNIRVSLEANGKFSNNIIHVTKGVFFVIASNIKCYENK